MGASGSRARISLPESPVDVDCLTAGTVYVSTQGAGQLPLVEGGRYQISVSENWAISGAPYGITTVHDVDGQLILMVFLQLEEYLSEQRVLAELGLQLETIPDCDASRVEGCFAKETKIALSAMHGSDQKLLHAGEAVLFVTDDETYVLDYESGNFGEPPVSSGCFDAIPGSFVEFWVGWLPDGTLSD